MHLWLGNNTFDVEQESYIPEYFLKDEKLKELEIDIKTKLYKKTKNRFKKYNIITETIHDEKKIVTDIFKLLERRKYANFH